MEPVEHPDVEDILRRRLGEELGVRAVTAVPNPRPSAYVRVMRTGGIRRTSVSDGPLVTVEAWAATRAAAADLSIRARAAVGALAGEALGDSFCYRVDEITGPANLPDPTSDQARYTFAVELHLRGRPAGGS